MNTDELSNLPFHSLIYLSFADEDSTLRAELEKHLSARRMSRRFDLWHRGKVEPGTRRIEELHQRMNEASLIILLVSASYLSSAEATQEMQKALELNAQRKAIIVPVILRPVDWKHTPLGNLEVLPRNGSPVTKWRDRGSAWVEIVKAIMGLIAPPPTKTGQFASAPAPRPFGENRVCTVMHVELARVPVVDPEEQAEMVELARTTIAAQVRSVGGDMGPQLTTKIVAFFGIPRGTDHDTERAVLAALQIHAAMSRAVFPSRLRKHLVARIGIATGRVFVEADSNGTFPPRVTGETLNEAEKLAGLAPPSTTWISSDTMRGVRGLFNVRLAPSAERPAGTETTFAYEVTGKIAIRNAIPSTRFYGCETSLVGRTAEMHAIKDALEYVVSESQLQFVTLAGDAGCGRSRLLAELFLILRSRPEHFVVLSAQCSGILEDSSYSLVGSLLRARFAIPEDELASATKQRLIRGLRWFRLHASQSTRDRPVYGSSELSAIDTDIGEALSCLLDVLQGPPRNNSPVYASRRDQPSGLLKRRIVEAVARLLRFAASRAPVVILCDDIHWADDPSLDLLENLSVHVSGLPILVVCTARSSLFERRRHWGEDGSTHRRIDVPLLQRKHIEEMIRDRLRGMQGPTPTLLSSLAERAERNPRILVETLCLLVDKGVIQLGAESCKVDERMLGNLSLPPSIQEVIQRRIDCLHEEARNILSLAAIVGKTFWASAVNCLTCQAADEETIDRTLDLLREKHFIRLREPSSFPGEAEYIFSENAMQEVAYQRLPMRLRRPAHVAVARWLEQRASGDAGANLLAWHYERGGDARRAAEEHLRAGFHADLVGEHGVALRHFERARTIHDATCASHDGSGNSSRESPDEERRTASWQDRVRLHVALADTFRRMGQLGESLRACEQARALILRQERRVGIATNVQEVTAWEARVDFRVVLVLRIRGDHPEKALEQLEVALQRAHVGGTIEDTPAMYAVKAFLCRRLGRNDEAWRAAMDGLQTCRLKHRAEDTWREDAGQLLIGVAVAQLARGKLVRAERSYRQAARLLRESTHPHLVAIAWNGVAGTRKLQGDLVEARKLYLRSILLKERAGDKHDIAVGHSNLSEVERELGDTVAALQHAQFAIALIESMGAEYDRPDMLRNLAEAFAAESQWDAALEAAEKAFSSSRTAGRRLYLRDCILCITRLCCHAVNNEDEATRKHAKHLAALIRDALLSPEFCSPDVSPVVAECLVRLAQHG